MKLSVRPMQSIALQIGEAWYPTLVLDFEEEKTLLVGVPQVRGAEIMISDNTPTQVELPAPDGVRRFASTVLRRVSSSPSGLLLSWPRDIERIQRRDFFRVDVMLPVELVYVQRAEDGTEVQRRVSGSTLDLSGGGVRVALPEPIPEGTEVELHFVSPGSPLGEVAAVAVRTGDFADRTGARPHWAGLAFAAPSEAFRKEVMRMVFDIQREQMRRA